MNGFENGIKTKLLCWSLALFVIGINIWTIFSYVSDPHSPTPYDTHFFVGVGVVGVAYLVFIAVIVKSDVAEFVHWVGTICNCKGSSGSGVGMDAKLTLNAKASETQPLLGGQSSLHGVSAGRGPEAW